MKDDQTLMGSSTNTLLPHTPLHGLYKLHIKEETLTHHNYEIISDLTHPCEEIKKIPSNQQDIWNGFRREY